MTRTLALKLTFVALSIVLSDSPASAESEAFCRAYAQNAVNAFQQKGDRCFPEGPPGRWQANFDNHFNWCRAVPASWALFEEGMRVNELRICRGEPKAVGCREYAINANSSQNSNLSAHCGFTGPRWQNNFDAHFSWCLPTPAEVANHEFNIRFAMLGVCGRVQEPFLRCDGYARQAVQQVNEANSRRCGFGGARWTPIYEDHLSWCIGVDASFANSETREREGPLSQCRTTNPVGPPPPPPEACSVSVVARNQFCLNQDGTPSSIVPGGFSVPGCGPDRDRASQRARAAFSFNFACISGGGSPSPGCCTIDEQTTPGCLCR